jgi:hypothetical protein
MSMSITHNLVSSGINAMVTLLGHIFVEKFAFIREAKYILYTREVA